MNETLRLISSRRSHRAYTSEQLTETELQYLLDAALASPSAMNRQPWHFSAVQNDSLLREINRACTQVALSRSNHSPRFADKDFDVFYHAPTVIFISGDPENYCTPIDCGIAVENIAVAAESLSLGSVILRLPADAFLSDQAAEFEKALHFPKGYKFVAAIAVGHAADTKEPHPWGENKIDIIS